MTNSIDDKDPYGFENITPQDVSCHPDHHFEENQFHAELMNVMSMSPFDNTVSGSRKQMFGASHITQNLVISHSTPRRIQTGAEQKYGKATFSNTVEYDCEVLRKFKLYNQNPLEENSIKRNPLTVLIVEAEGTDPERPSKRVIDCIHLTDYCSNHQYFGFMYKNKDIVGQIRGATENSPGTFLKAGTVLQDSPSKHDDGNYCYGRELNTVFASFDAVAEDGVILSEEALPWFEIKKIEKRSVSWGSTHYPVNLYGDENHYKPFPEIGDYIRPDGLLMALRSYNGSFSPVEMSARKLSYVNYTHDQLIYAPSGEGRVIDIRVRHDGASTNVTSPAICNAQALRYDQAQRDFYQNIYNYHVNVLKRRYGDKLEMTPRYRQLIRTAYSVVREKENTRGRGDGREKVQKIYRGSPMDDFTVVFVIEYTSKPKVGNKITDCWGG